MKGNLLTDLATLTAEAPEQATLVIFHTAVLGYVPSKTDRDRFGQAMRRSDAVWISYEVPSVFPDVAEGVPAAPAPRMFLLSLNGRPVAWTAPHGGSISWFGA